MSILNKQVRAVMRLPGRSKLVMFLLLAVLLVVVWSGAPQVLAQGGAPASPAATFLAPTYSSPIAVTNDKLFVWVVSPDDDSVYVINATTDTLVSRIFVGGEPQSIALDPNNGYAY